MTSMRTRGLKRAIFAALVLGCAGLAVAAALESAIRVFDLFGEERAAVSRKPGRGKAGREKGVSKLEVHPYLGWSRRPGAPVDFGPEGMARIFPGGKPTEWWLANNRSNLFGFRSRIEDYRTVGPERFAIGIFGGSVATGVALLGGETITRTLEEGFPELRGKIDILTFGFGGYKQPQQVILLGEILLLRVNLDAVVNVDGFNEVALGGQDAASGHHPIFPSRAHWKSVLDLLQGAPSEEFVETSAGIIREKRAARETAEWLRAHGWLRRSALAKMLAGRLSLLHQRKAVALEERLQALSVASEAGTPVVSLADPRLGKPDECWELIADLWERSSLLMAAMTGQSGVRYLHVLQPNQYVEGSKPLTDEERASAWKPEDPWSLSVVAGYPHLRTHGEKLKEKGIAFHDLTGVFSGHAETIYRDTCCHFNLEGNEILAREIALRLADLLRASGRGEGAG